MPYLPFRASLVALVSLGPASLCSVVMAASPGVDLGEVRDRRISTRQVGKPLAEVLASLSNQEVHLATGADLQETKASVILRDTPLGEALGRIAQVFGGEWVRLPGDTPRRLELRRSRAVHEWLADWRAARRTAEQTARKAQAQLVREQMERALAALDRPFPRDEDGREVAPPGIVIAPLAQVVRSLGAADRQRLAEHIAAISPVRAGGMAAALPPPLVVRFRDLAPEQQARLRDWIASRTGGGIREQRLRELPDTLVEFGSERGVSVEINFHLPSGAAPYGWPATTGAKSAEGLEAILRGDLFRRLAVRNTPLGALLGASLTPEGRVEPPVRIADAKLAGREVELPDNLLAAELLVRLAEAADLDLVADYHTRSVRLSLNSADPKVDKLMAAAAERFGLVLRQDGRFLMARSRWWPDRDEEETPAPHPERWIAMKKGGEMLRLDDLAVMGILSEARLAGLAAYRDDKVNFHPEVALVRRDRWVWGLVSSFSDTQRKTAGTPDGLPIRQLDPGQRAFLARSAGTQVPWDQARLYVHSWETPKPGKAASFAGAELRIPGASAPLWATLLQRPYGVRDGMP